MSPAAEGFHPEDAAALLALASAAEYDLSNFPDITPWSLIQIVTGPHYPGAPQGFVANGILPSSGEMVAVLAFGWQWINFLEKYLVYLHTLSGTPPGLWLTPPTGAPLCDLGYTTMYNILRTSVWTQVLLAQSTVSGFYTTMPLYVVGHGPAAPLAQLAAADLLPDKKFQAQSSPATSVASFAFSCPAFGNPEFATTFNAAVPNAYTVNLATAGGAPIDLFPAIQGSTYTMAGQVVGASAVIPPLVCPWFEREVYYYSAALSASSASSVVPSIQAAAVVDPPALLQAKLAPEIQAANKTYGQGVRDALETIGRLGTVEAHEPIFGPEPIEGRPIVRPILGPILRPGPIRGLGNGPSGDSPAYDATLAFAMTQLCAAAYQSFEHPSITSGVPAPYSLVTTLSANGVIWAALYQSPNQLVVAFRGPVTFAETVQFFGNDVSVRPNWLPSGAVQVLQCYEKLYEALAPAIRTALGKAPSSGFKIYLTGHCMGGALATIALLDLKTTPVPNAAPLGGVYTFGAPPIGNPAFQTLFQSSCQPISYQVVRPLDVIPKIVFGTYGVALPVAQQILLNGGETDLRNGTSYHTLVMYSSLLDPHPVPAAEHISPIAQAHYQGQLATAKVAWNEVNKCVLDSADSGGRILLSWNKAASFVTPTQYTSQGAAKIGVQDIVIQPGHELAFEAPPGGSVQVLARSVQLGAGARMTLNARADVSIGSLTAIPAQPGSAPQTPPVIVVLGADGGNGQSGPSGATGPAGTPGQRGGSGMNGVAASNGGNGSDAPATTLHVGHISGIFHAQVRGGHGGQGGAGGNGGIGGPGGPVRSRGSTRQAAVVGRVDAAAMAAMPAMAPCSPCFTSRSIPAPISFSIRPPLKVARVDAAARPEQAATAIPRASTGSGDSPVRRAGSALWASSISGKGPDIVT